MADIGVAVLTTVGGVLSDWKSDRRHGIGSAVRRTGGVSSAD